MGEGVVGLFPCMNILINYMYRVQWYEGYYPHTFGRLSGLMYAGLQQQKIKEGGFC